MGMRRGPWAGILQQGGRVLESLKAANVRMQVHLGGLALVAITALVRLWHVGWGLPDFTEEAIPLHLSLAMRSLSTGAIDWNPHAFNYPSLGIYLHLLVQQLVYFVGRGLGQWTSPADFQLAFDLGPTPMVLAARGLGVACDALSVLAAWRIGRRQSLVAGVVAGSLIMLSASFVVTSRSIYVDSIAVCLALWSLERMLAWYEWGGRGWKLLAAAVAAGLAAGAKYPAAVLLLPLGLLVLAREHEDGNGNMSGRWRDVLFTCAVATLVFLVSTPFALLDSAAFLRDFGFEGIHAAEGHFGSVGHRSFGFHLANLVRDLGWPALLLAATAPWLVWNKRKRRPVILALVLMVIAFGLPISLARIDAVRYLLPVIAAVALLAAFGADELVDRLPQSRRVPAIALLMVVLGVTPVLSGADAIHQGSRDTQVEARLWCEQHMRSDQLVITEGYGPRLADLGRIAALQESAEYRLAGAPWRAKVDTLHAMRVVALPLAVSGRLYNTVGDSAGAIQKLVVASHASAIAAVYYEPALYASADWFITTSAVRGRYEADSSRYATPCRLYALLAQNTELAAHFSPGRGAGGPEIAIYRVSERARTALAANGPVDPCGGPRRFHRTTA